jgi:hypothetical protein
MAAQYGRTVQDYTSFIISLGAAMVAIPVDSIGDVGLDYPEEEMAAFQDAIKGVLVGQPNFTLDFGGPFDNTATTGSHIILSAKLGVMTASSFDIQFGIRHAWVALEPQFGCSAVVASNSGIMVTKYKVTGGRFSATIRMIAGSAVAAIPAWGVAAEVVPA